ncbi:MAG: sigma-70 family RNA polymerase sigma factor [Crocinitomicaceae bacterium]|nr:sigma-70 family RNA polymerase sigma factor [Crocinitomicaceae bacterium]
MKSNKEEKFMALYTPVHENFERFCKARVYGDIDFKDLMHDTIVIAYEKFDKLEDPKAFLHFLFGICIRVLANTNKKKRLLHLKDDAKLMQVEDHSTRADRNEDVDVLYKALSKLPEEQREALVLFEISGFSIAEIAELQKAGVSAVKQRLSRGRQALLQLLRDTAQTQKEVSV